MLEYERGTPLFNLIWAGQCCVDARLILASPNHSWAYVRLAKQTNHHNADPHHHQEMPDIVHLLIEVPGTTR